MKLGQVIDGTTRMLIDYSTDLCVDFYFVYAARRARWNSGREWGRNAYILHNEDGMSHDNANDRVPRLVSG